MRNAVEALCNCISVDADEPNLVIGLPIRSLWAIEIKRNLAPRVSRGLRHAQQDLAPERTFIVYPGTERYLVREDVEVISLPGLCRILQQMAQ